jgi:alpha-N-arabinofuranosidase
MWKLRLRRSVVPTAVLLTGATPGLTASAATSAGDSGVAVLLIDTDRIAGTIDERIYGQFLEHINHSVVDGLYAEQVRGQGFEGNDFAEYWRAAGDQSAASLVEEKFEQGTRSVRLSVNGGTGGIRQDRFYIEAGQKYDGSVWLKPEQGSLALRLSLLGSSGRELATRPLETKGTGWQSVRFEFESATSDRNATLELVAAGTGTVLVDFISLMRARARATGKLRPDLLTALKGLAPPFIRWPGGSYASVYKWKDGIGPAVSRKYNPNTVWGGYSDYYGFGTDEFLELCRLLGSAPMIVLAATNTDAAQLEYALEWVHYLVDPPTTEWGRRRAANGHAEPYRVPYIQIDNEPMNHGLSPEGYAAIVNLYGPRLRAIAPESKLVACGQKRSNDMNWSEKLIDLAGANFDILGVHNYEYEPRNYATGVRRIEDYLEKLIEYVRISAHPKTELAVLEWGSARTYDWRAGLHAAGSLLMYEKLSPALAMTSPALLMRNTSDDPEWRAWIYHDHVSWFAGSGYVAEKLFRDFYAPRRHAFTSGTFADIPKRADFFEAISQMKPQDWTPNTVDAMGTSSADGRRIIIKAVNYDGKRHTLLTRLAGSSAPASASVRLITIDAALDVENSLAKPDALRRRESAPPYASDMAFELPPHSIAVVEIRASGAPAHDAK